MWVKHSEEKEEWYEEVGKVPCHVGSCVDPIEASKFYSEYKGNHEKNLSRDSHDVVYFTKRSL